jgi:hypothetical protein
LPDHVERFFTDGKTVFVKFVARGLTRLKTGHRLFFYKSRNERELVGEALITGIETKASKDVLADFGDRLFLTRQEIEHYARNRQSKDMLVLILSKLKKYPAPIRLKRPVTMAGQYMTKRMRTETGLPPESTSRH